MPKDKKKGARLDALNLVCRTAAALYALVHLRFGVLAFEECHVELTETPVELETEELRVPPPVVLLRIGCGIGIHVADTRAKDILYAKGQRGGMVLQELIADGCVDAAVRPVIAVGVAAHGTAPAVSGVSAVSRAAARGQYGLRGKVTRELEREGLGDLEGIEGLCVIAPLLAYGRYCEFAGVDGIDLRGKDVEVAGNVPPGGDRISRDEFQTADEAGFRVDIGVDDHRPMVHRVDPFGCQAGDEVGGIFIIGRRQEVGIAGVDK